MIVSRLKSRGTCSVGGGLPSPLDSSSESCIILRSAITALPERLGQSQAEV